jgi:RHS repeat-associated protein
MHWVGAAPRPTALRRCQEDPLQSTTFMLIPDAFGNTVATKDTTGSSYDFAATSGYRTDGDAGLMKVGARYYDPQVGSFTTRDTYLDQKPYLYCEHDPVNAVDPSGHEWDWVDDVLTVTAFVVGIAVKGPVGGVIGGTIGARPAWHAGARLTHWFRKWADREYDHTLKEQQDYWARPENRPNQ